MRGILKRAADLLPNLGVRHSMIEKELTLRSINAAPEILVSPEWLKPGAIGLARKDRSAVKSFFLGSATAPVCQYLEKLPAWVVGSQSLKPAHLLVALDEWADAEIIISYLVEHFEKLSGTRVTFFNVMPDMPPGFWDDGHILDKTERSERQRIVVKWHAAYEEDTGIFFKKPNCT